MPAPTSTFTTHMSTGAWVAIAAVTLALDLRHLPTAHRRSFPTPPAASWVADESVLADTPWADQLGDRATLLQFSSAFCAPCRATRLVLDDVSASTPGVAHVEVDAEQHLDVVRRLNILKTPTTLILDASGAEIGRATGPARKQQVVAALDALPK